MLREKTFNIFKNGSNLTNDDCIRGSLFGFFVFVALGVPVEFLGRETLQKNKISDMEAYGTHNQPKGTWSDDSSMVIATMDSLINERKINYNDIMNKFSEWYINGKYTKKKYIDRNFLILYNKSRIKL